MATVKQKLVIGRLIANPGEPIYKAMLAAGYTKATAKHPGKNLIAQPGFQDLLEEYLPDSLLLEALSEDIKKKPQNRHRELDLALKVKGKLKPAGESDLNKPGDTYNTYIQNNNPDPNSPSAKELVKVTLDALMAQTKRRVVKNEAPPSSN